MIEASEANEATIPRDRGARWRAARLVVGAPGPGGGSGPLLPSRDPRLPATPARSAAAMAASSSVMLPADSNQALGIAQYAIDFIGGRYGDSIDAAVWEKVEMFHTDSVMCGISALAMKTNAPRVLREEALDYPDPRGAKVFRVSPLSNRTCLTHDFFNSGEYCNNINYY